MNETSYRIAFSMYVALGGDPNATFESVDAVYDEIHKLLGVGGAENVETLKVNITRPGEYNYTPDNGIGYNPVLINVDIDATKFEFDFSEAGYDTKYNNAVNNFIYENTLNDIEISKNFMNEVNELMEDESEYITSFDINFRYTKFSYEYTLAYAPMLNYTKLNRQYGITDIFSSLDRLTYVPKIDTSTWTNMKELFFACHSLSTIPQLDTSNVEIIDKMFSGCFGLITLPILDFSNVRSLIDMFGGCLNLTNIGGFKNLGMYSSMTDNLDLSSSKKLTYESVMNVINNLYDRASAGMSVLTVVLHEYTLAKLSDADIAIATNKGWIIS